MWSASEDCGTGSLRSGIIARFRREAFAPIVAAHPNVLLLSSSQLQEISLGRGRGRCSSLIEALGFQLVSPPKLEESEPNTLVPISLETFSQLNDSVMQQFACPTVQIRRAVHAERRLL